MCFEIHGFPVIAFHYSTERHIRIICNFQLLHRRFPQKLFQCLQSVKCSTFISTGNNYLMISNPKIITFTLLRNLFPNRTDRPVISFTYNQFPVLSLFFLYRK